MVGFAGIRRMCGLHVKSCFTLSKPTCMECSRTGIRV